MLYLVMIFLKNLFEVNDMIMQAVFKMSGMDFKLYFLNIVILLIMYIGANTVKLTLVNISEPVH